MQDTKLASPSDHGARVEPGARSLLSVQVNGEPQRTAAATLGALLADLGYGTARVATAVNGDFVPERLRDDRHLAEGDAIEVVAPRQGG